MKKLLTIFVWMMIGTGICVAQQDSAFTFQGKLNDGGTAANGNYDMSFRIYDAVTGGTQVGVTVNVQNVAVANGIFSVELDFTHAPFVTVAQRYMEIGIRPAGSMTPPTLLSPRQKITSSPFASQAFNANIAAVANTANNLSCNGCVDEANVSPGVGAGIINTYVFSGPIANIPAGPSAVYIFAGPTTSVTISSAAGNRVTGSASAALATFSPSTAVINFAMCYQVNGGGTITPFDSDFLLSTVTSTRIPFSYSGTTVLPVGTHTVGFCVKNIGPAIENNQRVSGWVMVPK